MNFFGWFSLAFLILLLVCLIRLDQENFEGMRALQTLEADRAQMLEDLNSKIKLNRTLGNFGQPEFDFCYETEPKIEVQKDSNIPVRVCKAASLGCSSESSWNSLQECLKKL